MQSNVKILGPANLGRFILHEWKIIPVQYLHGTASCALPLIPGLMVESVLDGGKHVAWQGIGVGYRAAGTSHGVMDIRDLMKDVVGVDHKQPFLVFGDITHLGIPHGVGRVELLCVVATTRIKRKIGINPESGWQFYCSIQSVVNVEGIDFVETLAVGISPPVVGVAFCGYAMLAFILYIRRIIGLCIIIRNLFVSLHDFFSKGNV